MLQMFAMKKRTVKGRVQKKSILIFFNMLKSLAYHELRYFIDPLSRV